MRSLSLGQGALWRSGWLSATGNSAIDSSVVHAKEFRNSLVPCREGISIVFRTVGYQDSRLPAFQACLVNTFQRKNLHVDYRKSASYERQKPRLEMLGEGFDVMLLRAEQ
jgi:hypothetical protein